MALRARLVILIALVGCSEAPNSEPAIDRMAAADAGTPNAEPSASSSKPASGPFGIDIGAPLESVGSTTKIDGPGLYLVDNPPKAHSAFERVAVVAFPQTGICTVRGVSSNFANDSAGIQVRSAVDRLAEAMTLKYGKPVKRDACYGSDVDCEERWWLMSLRESQRTYGYFWDRGTPGFKSPTLGGVALVAQTADLSSPYILVEYVGRNAEACEAAVNQSNAEAL